MQYYNSCPSYVIPTELGDEGSQNISRDISTAVDMTLTRKYMFWANTYIVALYYSQFGNLPRR